MEPRPPHNGGSVSAKAGVELAALISARGTSVCARRSSMGALPAVGVWQIGKSGPDSEGELSAIAGPASATVTTLPATMASAETPPSKAAARPATNVRDGEKVDMSSSSEKNSKRIETGHAHQAGSEPSIRTT